MIYSIDEIRRKVAPVAQKYGLDRVYLFGSYARGEATDESDLDFLIETSAPFGLLKSNALSNSLQDVCHKRVDIITLRDLMADVRMGDEWADRHRRDFQQAVLNERKMLYEA